MVAFYITFMEANIGEPLAIKFAYVYYIKALATSSILLIALQNSRLPVSSKLSLFFSFLFFLHWLYFY